MFRVLTYNSEVYLPRTKYFLVTENLTAFTSSIKDMI